MFVGGCCSTPRTWVAVFGGKTVVRDVFLAVHAPHPGSGIRRTFGRRKGYHALATGFPVMEFPVELWLQR